MPNKLGIIKGCYGSGKTFLDLLVGIILAQAGKKVAYLSSSNIPADDIILKAIQFCDRLKTVTGKDVLNGKKCIRAHSGSTEMDGVDKEYTRYHVREENLDRARWTGEKPSDELYYDCMAFELIDRFRVKPGTVADRRYKLYEHSPGMCALRDQVLLDRAVPKFFKDHKETQRKAKSSAKNDTAGHDSSIEPVQPDPEEQSDSESEADEGSQGDGVFDETTTKHKYINVYIR